MKRLRFLTRDRVLAGRRAPSVVDWLITGVLLAIALAEIAGGMLPGPVGIVLVAQVASILPVAYRRFAPVQAIAIGALVALPCTILWGAANSLADALTLMVLIYAVGRYTRPRGLAVGTAFGLLVIVELGFGGRLVGPEDWVYVLVIYGVALALGVALRLQIERASELAVAADRAQREQEAAAQTAVLGERARIARELHDVVAHNVGLIVLQAGGARSVLATDPGRAREALLQVEATGRQTLAEMRHMVGILRIDDEADLQPLPRLDQLATLVDEARGAGLEVQLIVEGRPVELSAGLELAAYRLIQEALTNIRKHAPTATSRVLLRYEPDRLCIEVVNAAGSSDRAVPEVPAGAGPGHGLIGMRERVLLYDGRMQAGPVDGGGFRVEAVLPLVVTAA